MNVLFHSQSLLVHVAQIEHGLSAVQLVGCRPIVGCRRSEIHVRTPSVVVVVAQAHSGGREALTRRPTQVLKGPHHRLVHIEQITLF